ncbi:MAG: L-threonine 3-dehydrogenase [Planctomycetota bacterium]
MTHPVKPSPTDAASVASSAATVPTPARPIEVVAQGSIVGPGLTSPGLTSHGIAGPGHPHDDPPQAIDTTSPALNPEPEINRATMRALVKHHAGEGLELDPKRPMPTVGPHDCLIRIHKAGICGTDRHIWEWDEWAQSRIPVGIVTGHEFVGVIAAIGQAVTKYKVGERVSAEGHLTKGRDYLSLTGNKHIASDVHIFGVDSDGIFADYAAIHEDNIWDVHPDVPDKYAAVYDPLGNAVHTVMAAGVSGKTVLVSGTGIIGLMTVAVAKAAGATRIYCTDINPPRLELAKKLGAHRCFDVRPEADGDSWIHDLRAETRGLGVDCLLEMSGAPKAMDQGFQSLRPGGVAALLGLPARSVDFDFNANIIFKGCTVLGINGRKMWETWYQVEEFIRFGGVNLDDIITHEFAFNDYEEAFRVMMSGEGIKVLLDMTR